jgi:hypothetical protein
MQFAFTRPSFAFVATVLSVASGSHGSITITSQSYQHELLVPNLASPPVPVVTQTPGFYEAVIAPQTYDIQGFYPIYPEQFISNVTDAASSSVTTNATSSNLSLQLQTRASRVVNVLAFAEYSDNSDKVLARVSTFVRFSLAADSQVQLSLVRSAYSASGSLNRFPLDLNMIMRSIRDPSGAWGLAAPEATGVSAAQSIFLPAGEYSVSLSSGPMHGPYADRFIAPGSMDMTIDFSITVIPSPGVLGLAGMGGLVAMRRRRLMG